MLNTLLLKTQVIAGMVNAVNPKNSVTTPLITCSLGILGGLIYLNKILISRIIKTIEEKLDEKSR